MNMRKTLPGGWEAAIFAGAGAITGTLIAANLRRNGRSISLTDRVVVITGGSRGLGLALAHEFGCAGASLVLAARDSDELNRAKELLLQHNAVRSAEDVLLVECDLSKPLAAAGLIERATGHFGKVNVLVNNASLIHLGPIEQQPMEAFRESMEVGYFAMVEATKAVLPQMLGRRNGSIVNIASVGGKMPVPHLAPYCGTKFAAVGFSETLHAEVRSKGVHVTTVCPGLMRTGSFPNALVVGDLEKEYAWFATSAAMPGLSNSAERAARKIFRAAVEGRTEITIGPETALAARLHGIAPAVSQFLAHLAEDLLLPEPNGESNITPARSIAPPRSRLFRILTRSLTAPHNEPAP